MDRLTRRLGGPQSSRASGQGQAGNLDDLSYPLCHFGADPFTVGNACEGVQIFGAIGSGKTSGSGAYLARAFLNAGFGGLVCTTKPEDRKLWQRFAAQTGRTNHLVFVRPGGKWHFNFLAYEMKRTSAGGGSTENIVGLLRSVVEVIRGEAKESRGIDHWDAAKDELLRNAIDLISLSGRPFTLEMICDMIISIPRTRVIDGVPVSDLANPAWEAKSLLGQLIGEAEQRATTPRQVHDLEMAARFWLKSFPELSERTRSSISNTFTAIADLLLHGDAWELLSTDTTIVPEVTYKNGAIIVLDMPVQQYGEVGRVVQGIFKYMFQQAILRRDAETDPRPVFLWCDEAQNFISSFDYQFQSTARSARACTVYLTQNISNYYAKLGANGQSQADSLMGNFQTKIFHQNTDRVTNQYAAETIAQAWTQTHGYSVSSTEQGTNLSGSGSDSLQYQVQPGEFITLRKGSPANAYQVEAVIIQGGRIWKTSGGSFLRAKFTQDH